MRPYLDLVTQVLMYGDRRRNRTGIDTFSVFGTQTRYDLRDGFPLVTTKYVPFKSVVRELLWFLSGSTNVHELHPCKIWDEWANENGYLGPIYGQQWRGWRGLNRFATEEADGRRSRTVTVDQITQVIEQLKTDPMSRRHIVSAWNVADIPYMALPPCHVMFQFYASAVRVKQDGEPVGPERGYQYYLDCQLYQRSADLALGVPFNIASYALLMSMVAQEIRMLPRYFIHTIGDAHIYVNHVDGLRQQLQRQPKQLPYLELRNVPVLALTEHDIGLRHYEHDEKIEFEVAV